MLSPAAPTRSRGRGRPPKYGRPSELVAVTLPSEVLELLRARHSDVGWAIVSLVEEGPGLARPRSAKEEKEPPEHRTDLARISADQSMIVVSTPLFHALPGVQLVPLSQSESFLALAPGKGMADLELSVIDRLDYSRIGIREREALTVLLEQLRKWRKDPGLSFEVRSIIIVNRKRRSAAADRPGK